MKKLFYILLALSLFACKGKEETVRFLGNKIYDPVYVAYEKGFFGKHNVNVEYIELIAGGPTALQAVAAGNADICGSSYMAIINARAQGLPVIAISDLQSSIGAQALEEFFVRKDSGIDRVSDLKGKTVAVNLVKSSFHYSWKIALANAGMSESDVNFVILPFDQQEIALANGHVDAIGLMHPFNRSARNNLGLKTLMTALDIFGERQFTAHVANSVWANKNPGLAKGFAAAVADAANWIEGNQEEAKLLVSKYTGVSPANMDDYHFQKNAAVIMSDAQYWLDYMKGSGEISADWLNVGDIATNRFNPD